MHLKTFSTKYLTSISTGNNQKLEQGNAPGKYPNESKHKLFYNSKAIIFFYYIEKEHPYALIWPRINMVSVLQYTGSYLSRYNS